MKKKVVYFAFPLVVLVLICVLWFSTPEHMARRFVEKNSTDFSEIVNSELTIPVIYNGKEVDVWNGEHPMYEFTLSVWGDTYYGCYYSPDDVPLSFQNCNIALIGDGKGGWTWSAEGDNHGRTKKIFDKWYYFEASF